MWKARALFGVALTLGLSALVPLQAQQKSAKAPGATATLTPTDYIEIQQLCASYGYAFDTGDDQMLANLYTEDGVFIYRTRVIKGRENLAAFLRSDRVKSTPQYAHIFSGPPIITATAEGATGKVYVAALDIGEGGKPGAISGGGRYEDIYEKTAQGWRIKKREYVLSKAAPAPAAASVPPPATR